MFIYYGGAHFALSKLPPSTNPLRVITEYLYRLGKLHLTLRTIPQLNEQCNKHTSAEVSEQRG